MRDVPDRDRWRVALSHRVVIAERTAGGFHHGENDRPGGFRIFISFATNCRRVPINQTVWVRTLEPDGMKVRFGENWAPSSNFRSWAKLSR